MTKKSPFEHITEAIAQKRSFILEAGAGSGKTWTLIQSLRHLLLTEEDILKRNNQKIVCITYTNVAKDEINERLDYNEMVIVRTIHDFLWSVIGGFQAELRAVLVDHNKAKKNPVENFETILPSLEIIYSQFGPNLEEGKLFHDDIIAVSALLFERYPKLSNIVADKYPYLFIDEYQDTAPEVIGFLETSILKHNQGKIVVGLFGDSMQKIYKGGVGKVESKFFARITKTENFRCSLAVINLLNNFRVDLKQVPAGANLPGQVNFYHCNNNLESDQNYIQLRSFLANKKSWDFADPDTKVLFLTHRGIAQHLNYDNLIKVYSDYSSFGRERLFEKEDRFADIFFNHIEPMCYAYEAKEYGEFLNLAGNNHFEVQFHKDKANIKTKMDALSKLRKGKTIAEVLDFAFSSGLVQKTGKVIDFEKLIQSTETDEKIQDAKTFYQNLMKVPYREVSQVYEFIEDNTPFSTKHGVKGDEFKDVLVVIDDRSWKTEYNFNYLFSGNTDKSQYQKSLNLFYVCCSRAKDRLAVLSLSKIEQAGITTIAKWFGAKNVHCIKTIV